MTKSYKRISRLLYIILLTVFSYNSLIADKPVVDINAGIYQLSKIDKTLKKQRFIAERYTEIFKKFNDYLYFYEPPKNTKPAWYRFYIFLKKDLKNYKNLREKIVEEFIRKKIKCNYGACPEIYLEKAFKNSRFKVNKRLNNCKLLGETSIALDVNHMLTKKDISLDCKKIYKILNTLLK